MSERELISSKPIQWIETLKTWLKGLSLDPTHLLFPGGVVTEFQIPVNSPFCMLEIPQKRTISELYLNGKKFLTYEMGIQLAAQNRNLWDGFLEVKYLTDLLSMKIMAEETEITGISDIEIGDVEYFYMSESKNGQEPLLFCSRMPIKVYTEEVLEFDEVQYETIVMQLRDIQNTKTIEEETFTIEQEDEE
jgi:hypothetical protein